MPWAEIWWVVPAHTFFFAFQAEFSSWADALSFAPLCRWERLTPFHEQFSFSSDSFYPILTKPHIKIIPFNFILKEPASVSLPDPLPMLKEQGLVKFWGSPLCLSRPQAGQTPSSDPPPTVLQGCPPCGWASTGIHFVKSPFSPLGFHPWARSLLWLSGPSRKLCVLWLFFFFFSWKNFASELKGTYELAFCQVPGLFWAQETENFEVFSYPSLPPPFQESFQSGPSPGN